MQNPAVDLNVLSELIQQLALAQAANQAAVANGGAETAPTASAAPALNTAPVPPPLNATPAPVAANANANPTANAPAGYFRCPNCDTLHQLVVAAASPAAASAGTPVASACSSSSPSSTANDAGSWYSVTRGRQVGVFRGWDTIVASLVEGVPRWRCKRFATEQQAQAHFNRCLMMNDVHIHNDE
ncbi:hypothetical protein PTI98_000461 [Pleurotus ostreatus]|uniref:Ribonuclease H1 N-terminal domain-containing protein n=1 Tax=Pleurotus ostreatus (strain PC15) TaxID=1137138 RepID=A0A067NX68_PLEO1|nr:hypothetical protein PTI98_013546 [Pleurotus ostreatus]KAJ8688821.1 hypothetical protein PTI98_013566 [Pleurotus ostreatus]KAJ8701701.1 hypothetical protein PTI98_000461 [Pleurotus ostreatus]KDQ31595.1 hypothetical protein PLEOSDRAFT_1102555 [Pleurotus ostreatus PC15]KDQ32509.1 hypothetical protein PLEOSDRAFT_156252 [Pleurotus ostreatus PC15]